MKNPFDVLNIPKDSTEEEIESAYKALSKVLHPDVSKHPNAEKAFIDINNAYESLMDPIEREKYINDSYKEEEEEYDYDSSWSYQNEYYQSYTVTNNIWRYVGVISVITLSVILWSSLLISYVVISNSFSNFNLDNLNSDYIMYCIYIIFSMILVLSIDWKEFNLAIWLSFIFFLTILKLSIGITIENIIMFTYLGLSLIYLYFIYEVEEEYFNLIFFGALSTLMLQDIFINDWILLLLIIAFITCIMLVMEHLLYLITYDIDYELEWPEIFVGGLIFPVIGSIVLLSIYLIEKYYIEYN